ncbi:hypothetical protein PIB30_045488 [Stylosanthes scabra]|uniref:Uncharacterized protein n=1 Tax=Stylosanthes scabra TaxID=79078 RepID=A0ABU6XH28_9FABA|nr:hypothetical protein [Stylosanthes scabra]
MTTATKSSQRWQPNKQNWRGQPASVSTRASRGLGVWRGWGFGSRMTRNGKTPTKGSASTAAGSTAGNLGQPLLHSCFRKVSEKNSS